MTGSVAGQLPQPRSDLATATLPDPTGDHGWHHLRRRRLRRDHYLPSVLATTDGTHFTTVAQLPVPVRYPAVVADGRSHLCLRRSDAVAGCRRRWPPTTSR